MSNRKTKNDGLRTVLGSIAVLLLVAAVIGGIVWFKMQQMKASMSAPPPPEMPVAVKLVDAHAVKFQWETVVVGSVLSDQAVQLRNELTGVVTKVAMEPGQIVKAGDVLVELDDRVEQAHLKSAKANLRLSKAVLDRVQQLNRVNANTEQELDAARAEADVAAAAIDRLQTMIDRKKITAMFDARVGLFDLDVGQYLAEGTEIATLEGVADFMNVDFALPAHVADSVVVGDFVDLRVNDTSPKLTAKIVAMDSRADPVSRALRTRARLDDPPPTLLPGDAVRVSVKFGPELDAVEIPTTAIRRGPTGTSVYLAVEQDSSDSSGGPQLRAQARTVKVAGGGGESSRVMAGLDPGDQVVAIGSFKVHEGSLLSVAQEPGAESTATPQLTIDAGSAAEQSQ